MRKDAYLRIGTLASVSVLVAVLILSLIPTVVGSAAASDRGIQASTSGVTPVGRAGTTAPIQAEIDSSLAGAVIHLHPGTFVGQLQINHSVRIVGAGEGKTILQSPTNMTPDSLGNVFVVEVGNHATVELSHLTIRVTEQCMLANSIGVATGGGVGVRDNSTLHVWDANVVAYGPYPDLDQPCTTHGSPGMISFGRAISIGLDDPPGVGTNLQVEGHGFVKHVETQGFDIFSISVGGVRGPSGSTASISDNLVRVGPGPYTAAYGIVVYGVSSVTNNLVIGEAGSDGGIAVVYTSATVLYNTIEDFTCTNAPFPIVPPCGVDPLYDDQDLGIFLAGLTPGTIVEHNAVEFVDAGILVEGPGAPAVITHNSITNSTYYGLDLIDANQTFHDDVVLGGLYAIAVGAASSNTTAVLSHDTLGGYSVAIGLLEANYPWVAKLVVRPG